MFTVPATTAAREWDAARAAATRWVPPAVPTTVVVPHPDDEALLFGGLIHHQRQCGVPVRVLAVTDGEHAYPDAHRSTLARRRRAEQVAALATLGVRPSDVTRLGVADGSVAHVVDRVADAISATSPRLVVAPWAHDHHTDHEACGRAAAQAADDTGAILVGGLFWAWHRTSPSVLDGLTLIRLRLDARGQEARRRALAAHGTQLGDEFGDPVLGAELLEPVRWTSEYYVPVAGMPGGGRDS